jgi:hypothetical protein
MGQEPRTFRTRGEEKGMEIKLHGTIALPTRHLLKERLMFMYTRYACPPIRLRDKNGGVSGSRKIILL